MGDRLGDSNPLLENTACVPDTNQGLSVARVAGLAKPEREYLAQAKTLAKMRAFLCKAKGIPTTACRSLRHFIYDNE